MKTFLKHYLLACITLFSVACSNSAKLTDNEFLIEGKISGVEDGFMIMLFSSDNWGFQLIDTVKNGRFTFKGKALPDPELMYIVPFSDWFPSMALNVWVAPGSKTKIKGKGKVHLGWKVKSTFPYQKEENRYAKGIWQGKNFYNAVRYSQINVELRDRSIRFYNREILNNLIEEFNELTLQLLFVNISIMEKTEVSHVWLKKMLLISKHLRSYDRSNPELREKAKELYGRMSEEDKITPIGNEITTTIFPTITVGDNMADADLLDEDGNTKRLADYLGKYLLLDFWASWCGPCRAAFPELKEIAETYRDILTVIAINQDADNLTDGKIKGLDADALWKKAMAEHDMPWVNLRDPKSWNGFDRLAANYGFGGIPSYVIISPEGKIIDVWWGSGTLKSKVAENLGL